MYCFKPLIPWGGSIIGNRNEIKKKNNVLGNITFDWIPSFEDVADLVGLQLKRKIPPLTLFTEAQLWNPNANMKIIVIGRFHFQDIRKGEDPIHKSSGEEIFWKSPAAQEALAFGE